jgi:hypothetical protein
MFAFALADRRGAAFRHGVVGPPFSPRIGRLAVATWAVGNELVSVRPRPRRSLVRDRRSESTAIVLHCGALRPKPVGLGLLAPAGRLGAAGQLVSIVMLK